MKKATDFMLEIWGKKAQKVLGSIKKLFLLGVRTKNRTEKEAVGKSLCR